MADIRTKVKAAGIRSQAMILVGSVLDATDFADWRLYARTSATVSQGQAPRGERVKRGGSWVRSRP